MDKSIESAQGVTRSGARHWGGGSLQGAAWE